MPSLNRLPKTLCHTAACVLVLSVGHAQPSPAAQFKFPTQTFTLPDGFEIELVAGPALAPRPIAASFDEQGRLYVTDSSGSNDKPDVQLREKPHRVLRLEDTDSDGKFDHASVFADQMMFPEGCLWHEGSLYVAAPPSIWKLTDTDGNGVADKREEWHQGKTLTGCANDLHGPYLGPDGWFYWCKGAFAEQPYEQPGQKPFVSRAAHIFRARPDHSGLEPVMTGGMDNPVGLAFTATGDRILCGTFFVTHEPGHRDGLIHAIYGGVYGKINEVTDSHKKTGDLMPIMTHMGPAAPCSVIRYESKIFGSDYQDNLFACAFNLHKISRHVLEADGATYKTKDTDFLVSDNPDFHPTDVIEDADGSLLVIDTGGWYKICCPTSQLSKPDVLGAIYRVRRTGARKIDDLRGLQIQWPKETPAELADLLGDERVFVQRRALAELGKRGDVAVPALKAVVGSGPRPGPRRNKQDWLDFAARVAKARSAEWPNGAAKRQKALWALTRIESATARATVRKAFDDSDTTVRCVALQSASLHRDEVAADSGKPDVSITMFLHEERFYFELLGRTRQAAKLPYHTGLMINEDCLRPSHDRVLQHSFTYALIESGAAKTAREYLDPVLLKHERPAALIALDQMENGSLTAKEVAPFLEDQDPDLGAAALWIVRHHPEWGEELAASFKKRLESDLSEAEISELETLLGEFAPSPSIQELLQTKAANAYAPKLTRLMALHAMAGAGLKQIPPGWTSSVRNTLDQDDTSVLLAAVATARALSQTKTNAPNFSEALARIGRDPALPTELRLEALSALPGGLRTVDPPLFDFLCARLNGDQPVMTRGAAANVLSKARLKADQLTALADLLRAAGPLELSKLITAFEHSTNATVGLKLVGALKEAKALASLRPDLLRTALAKYPPEVQEQGKDLFALMNVDTARQAAHVDELLASLKDGDIRRGQLVFNSQKAACSACHTLGYLGGHVGPDLTSIGQVRTERDLLESIVYPSASFVRSFEPYAVTTKAGEDFSGVVKKDSAEEVVLATGPGTEVRLPRADIVEMRPGKVSLMPAGLDEQLSKQELADLVVFLKATKWGPR